MKRKHQRLFLGLAALGAIGGASGLALSALQDQAAFFYTPSDVATKSPLTDKAVRLGGMVEKGSIRHLSDGVTIAFVVTDNAAKVPVRFTGVAPDLFKEGSGVVAEGKFTDAGGFVADNLLAKHDERYMPPEIADKMAAAGAGTTAAGTK
ncbi:cytochrome c maturation protein CcmE [Sphingomonas turrisvirgatae]|uniref:Cytochrome c-type biogenesis protein CcmE n=1 Tax=Sphingomonas turrisvirgatae TaxID=1888892 RepID=A0A1E3LR18_9SPHN|nr:cytochrome c maturation protein CcmE [Sphingomonas turrisvirgatae]ODP36211.1 cytochrome c biogenesis protein CcmE [Sphingomonas turrisvirgatae]